jgi:iron complex transport system ATP-binding protein
MSALLECAAATAELSGRPVLPEISVGVPAGALTAIVGPNGSGKSTLLRMLAGLIRPAAGTVRLGGVSLETLTRREIASRIAFLPQHTTCDFAFTVEEAVAMGRHPHRGAFAPARHRDRAAVASALARCDLEGLRGRLVDRLSGGEAQRVAIARCLAAEPEVMLLDEPTAHLDLEHSFDIFDRCRALARAGRAVAVATHDLSTAAEFATSVVVLHRGRVAASGAPARVLTPDLCSQVFAVTVEVVDTAAGAAFLFRGRPRHAPQVSRGAQ